MNFTAINSKGDFAYFDHTENAIDSLETACFLLNRTGNTKWKWISITIHHSLYSFCVSYLHKGNYERVSSINEKSGKRELINFDKALNKTLNTPYNTFTNGKTKKNIIKLTKEQREKIDWLAYEIRNNFVHFIPQVTSVEIKKIKSACLAAINLIELIAVNSYSIIFIDFEDSQSRIKSSLEKLRSNLS
ncbi:MAG: hypothetical protein M0Q21_12805 [Ignavibacteriaceae bacterium]|nr:hypothetical protein [Ignavibacteriaceae bacterium]